ncbi:class I SAM-dependent methyltransferase [Pseudogemmobacter blasticus]|nr:class I SAM-dependent methyltransferase [Fuscovulum blasticum]
MAPKSDRPNYFRDHLAKTGDRALLKMDHYLDVYHDLLRDWQGSDISFLEIGVYKGGSLDLWQGFFGPKAKLVFADIDPECRAMERPGLTIEIGDQSDGAFLDGLAARHGPFDLIIDDGGHKMNQQTTSLRHLWPHLNDGGLYVVEDTHTSYWPGFGGGLRKPDSMVEVAKQLVDQMHSWYSDEPHFKFYSAAQQIGSIRFHDSMIILEKRLHDKPRSLTARNGAVSYSTVQVDSRNRKSVF